MAQIRGKTSHLEKHPKPLQALSWPDLCLHGVKGYMRSSRQPPKRTPRSLTVLDEDVRVACQEREEDLQIINEIINSSTITTIGPYPPRPLPCPRRAKEPLASG